MEGRRGGGEEGCSQRKITRCECEGLQIEDSGGGEGVG